MIWRRSPRTSTVRIGYARVSGRGHDHQMQLDALAAAHCREVIVEAASTRGARPKPRATLDLLKPGDTLVIYKPDRIARSMKELLVLLSMVAAMAAEMERELIHERTMDGLAATNAQGRYGDRPIATSVNGTRRRRNAPMR